MAILRYALNDGINPVTVQNSWVEETYYRPIQVVNGMVETDDELEIFALYQRGFVIVEGTEQPQPEEVEELTEEVEVPSEEVEEPTEEVIEEVATEGPTREEVVRSMTRAELIEEAGRLGVEEDLKGLKKDELVDVVLIASDED